MDLFPADRNSSRSSARVLQRSESLPHLMELAQRCIELVRTRAIRAFLLRIAFASAAKVHGEQSAQDAEGNEGRNDHLRGLHADDAAF